MSKKQALIIRIGGAIIIGVVAVAIAVSGIRVGEIRIGGIRVSGIRISEIFPKQILLNKKENDSKEGISQNNRKTTAEMANNHLNTEKEFRSISLLFGGDVMLGRSVNTRQIKYGSWNWAWQEISELTREADMTMVNLETPVIKNCASTDEGMIFCAPADSVNGLVEAGVDVVNLANNHTYNQGVTGFRETQKILKEAGVLFTGVKSVDLESGAESGDKRGDEKGAEKGDEKGDENNNFINSGAENNNQNRISNLAIYKIRVEDENNGDNNRNQNAEADNGEILIGVLGYDDVSNFFSENEIEQIKTEISQASQKVDILVVTWHWGVEYQGKPGERQQSLSHESATAGADIIIGHHPHWLQTYEEYQGVPIYYSLGNLIFDQMWSEETRRGLLVKTFWQKNETSEKWQITEKIEFPIQIYDYGQPQLITI